MEPDSMDAAIDRFLAAPDAESADDDPDAREVIEAVLLNPNHPRYGELREKMMYFANGPPTTPEILA